MTTRGPRSMSSPAANPPEPRVREMFGSTLGRPGTLDRGPGAVILVAVILAQALDAATWAAMPAWAEANRLIAGMHSASGWSVKALLVVLVFAVELVIRFAPPPRFRAVALVNRALAQLIAVLAIAAGCIGAGANLSVLTAIASETPRSSQEPAPIASEATGIEQGAIAAPAAPGRTPAPSGVGIPPSPAAAERMGRAAASRGSLLSRSMPALIIPRGTASWYPAAGMVAAAGPALRQALGRRWRGQLVRVVAGDRSVVVRLSDWCQCYRATAAERLVDLSDDAFGRLAPLAAGLIVVRIGVVRLVPPATDR